MSRQLINDDSSKDWIELTDSLIKEYGKKGGLYLAPGQEIKFGLSYTGYYNLELSYGF